MCALIRYPALVPILKDFAAKNNLTYRVSSLNKKWKRIDKELEHSVRSGTKYQASPFFF